jgi:cell division protein FtsI (penicillin-binding protein 3)
MRVLTDAKGRGIDSQLEEEPRPGTSLTISIDERIQFPAEIEIERAVQDAHAESGSVVALDPYHGDVLAMASYPPFDPNQPPARGESASVRFNHALSVPFEPGSVFKVITLSAALETTNLRPDTLINCGNGTITLFGRTIHEAHQGYGTIPMAMVLAKSSNIGAIQIGMRVGQNNLYEYVRRFGFGTRTGLPLPAESPGMVRKLSRWGATSLSSVAMGHEVGVTTLQLAQACAVVANGGLLVTPRLILQKGQAAAPAVAPRRILQPATAITMRQMMEGVVLYGTGKKAKLDGYSVGGKTGSAQIYDFATRHYTHSYNASFMGFAPVTNPAIVVVVTLNGTHGSSGFGGAVAAPVFRVIAGEALRVLDVPKDLPDAKPDTPEKPADLDDVAIADLGSNEPSILEEAGQISGQAGREQATGAAVKQVSEVTAPAPNAQRASQAPREIGLAGGSACPTTPNFIGLSKRATLALAQAQGVPVLTVGIGVVRTQHPPPGAALRAGERIRVELLR